MDDLWVLPFQDTSICMPCIMRSTFCRLGVMQWTAQIIWEPRRLICHGEVQKQMIGEKLFPMISKIHPDQAGKITGSFANTLRGRRHLWSACWHANWLAQLCILFVSALRNDAGNGLLSTAECGIGLLHYRQSQVKYISIPEKNKWEGHGVSGYIGFVNMKSAVTM